MQICMPYGNKALEVELVRGRHLGTLDVADTPGLPDPVQSLRIALDHPIGMPSRALDGFRGTDRIAVVVSDSFRTTRMEQLLPALLDGIQEAGGREENVFFLFATGSHRGPTEEEARRILGPSVYDQFHSRAFTYDPADTAQLVYRGTTSRRTPVYLNRRLLKADRVIVTGTVVLHYFGGFGGGRKAILPGLAGMESIAHNHSLNLHPTEDRLDPAVRIGVLDGNPVAEDMLEGARFCRVDFLVNTVLNRRGEIAGIFAGEMEAAHRAACSLAHEMYVVPISGRADIVVASAGNARNFIQSHKALFNAYQAVKPGGRIVFLTAAPEGFGGNKFAQWLSLGTRERIIAELRKNAEINGQTALSTLEKGPITLFVTELTPEQCALMGGRKAENLSGALDLAFDELRESGVAEPSYYLMPSASYSVPVLA